MSFRQLAIQIVRLKHRNIPEKGKWWDLSGYSDKSENLKRRKHGKII